eukprot:COSAG05_NODE_395_length_10351_cov_9.372318_1_plen_39_part_00
MLWRAGVLIVSSDRDAREPKSQSSCAIFETVVDRTTYY